MHRFPGPSTGSSDNIPGANMVVESDVGSRWTPPRATDVMRLGRCEAGPWEVIS